MATVAIPVHEVPNSAPVIPPVSLKIPLHKRYPWMRWIVPGALLVIAGVVWQVWRVNSNNAITYETVSLEHGMVQASVTATGTVNAVVDVLVGSQVSGNIKTLYADFNTKVAKGQLVALIDPAVFQTQVDQAQSALASARSSVGTAQAQIQKANSDLGAAVATGRSTDSVMAKDRATAVNARAQWTRLDSLFKDGITSQQSLEAAKAILDSAEAQVAADQAMIEASKQTIQSARDQIAVTQAQLGSANGQQQQAAAVLDQAKINLGHTRITAPVDGTVIARRMDVGQTVAASFAAPTVFEIAQDLTKMQLDTNVDESDVGNISVDQDTTFTVDAYPATTFKGKVIAVRKAPIVTQNVVTYDVVISVANVDLKLFPGMTANVRIFTTKSADTLKVPNAVLRLHPSAAVLKQLGVAGAAGTAGKDQVFVLRDDKLTAVPVVFGISDGRYTAVQPIASNDLRAGEQIVVRFSGGAGATASKAALPAAGGGQRRTPGL